MRKEGAYNQEGTCKSQNDELKSYNLRRRDLEGDHNSMRRRGIGPEILQFNIRFHRKVI